MSLSIYTERLSVLLPFKKYFSDSKKYFSTFAHEFMCFICSFYEYKYTKHTCNKGNLF